MHGISGGLEKEVEVSDYKSIFREREKDSPHLMDPNLIHSLGSQFLSKMKGNSSESVLQFIRQIITFLFV